MPARGGFASIIGPDAAPTGVGARTPGAKTLTRARLPRGLTAKVCFTASSMIRPESPGQSRAPTASSAFVTLRRLQMPVSMTATRARGGPGF